MCFKKLGRSQEPLILDAVLIEVHVVIAEKFPADIFENPTPMSRVLEFGYLKREYMRCHCNAPSICRRFPEILQ